MSTVPQFTGLLLLKGSDAVYHKDSGLVPCPCRTPEGFRDPEWHLAHPTEPICNEAGFLPDPTTTTNISVKAFMQPIQSTRATRLSTEQLVQMFGEIQADDHLGIFPCEWSGTALDFYNWGTSGEDYVGYNGRRFTVVNANLIPDPDDGNPFHHWEIGARLISSAAL
jgi:hypothetical protein